MAQEDDIDLELQADIEYFLKKGEEEGLSWKSALKDFDELKKELLDIDVSERLSLVNNMVDSWMPKREQATGLSKLMKQLSGEEAANNLSDQKWRGFVKGESVKFMSKPGIGTALELLKCFPSSVSMSDAMGTFTHRVETVIFHKIIAKK